MLKIYKLIFFIIISFLLIGCSAELAVLKDDLNGLIKSDKNEVSAEKSSDIYLQKEINWHESAISKSVLTNDKKFLISVANEKNIFITDLKTGKVVKKIIGNIGDGLNGSIYTIALSPDNKYLVAGGFLGEYSDKLSIGTIRIYDFNTFELLKTIKSHEDIVTDLNFSEDGKYLVSSGLKGGILNIWEMNNFILKKSINLNSYVMMAKIVKRNNDYKIITISMDNYLRMYNIEGKLLREQYIYTSLNAMAINQNEIAVGCLNYKYIEFYDFNLNRIQKIDYRKSVREMEYSPDGKTLLVGNTNSQGLYLFDRKLGNFRLIESNQNIFMYSLIKFLDESNVLISKRNGELNTLNLNTLENKIILKGEKPISSIGFSDNKIAISRNDEGNLKDREKEDFFNTYLDLEKFTMVNKNIPTKIISNKQDEYSLKIQIIKGFIQNIPYLTLMKNNEIKSKIQYNQVNFNTYGFFNDFIVGGGQQSIIYDRDFNKLADLNGNGSFIVQFGRYENYLLSLNNLGIIEFWNIDEINKNKYFRLFPKLSLYIAPNNEWVMWTPQGYFNGSENGYKYIGFHINQGFDKEAKWVGIEKLYDHFYRPDLVELALKGEDITAYTKGLSYKEVLKNPAPKIQIIKVDNKNINSNEITYKKDEINLEFSVNQIDNGGVGIIRIYQEGKLVKTLGDGEINRQSANALEDLESLKINQKAKQFQEEYLAKFDNSVTKAMNGTIDESELINDVKLVQSLDNSGIHKISLPLKSGINKIEIEAFNKSNSVASIREKLNVDAKIKKREPIVYAIIAGVDNFEDIKRFNNLKYSQNDANSINEILKTKVKEKVFSTLLLGENFTKENLFKAINDVKLKAKLEDKIIFYVSTHGKVFKGDLHLVPQNNKYAKDFIKFEEMFKEIQSIPALDQIFVIDACESGSAKDIVSSIYDSKASVLAKQSGVHVLLATAKGTFAFEHPNPNIKHGVFTNNILTALQSKKTDENKDNKISIIELSKVLRNPEYITDYQYPIIRNVGQDTKVRDF